MWSSNKNESSDSGRLEPAPPPVSPLTTSKTALTVTDGEQSPTKEPLGSPKEIGYLAPFVSTESDGDAPPIPPKPRAKPVLPKASQGLRMAFGKVEHSLLKACNQSNTKTIEQIKAKKKEIIKLIVQEGTDWRVTDDGKQKIKEEAEQFFVEIACILASKLRGEEQAAAKKQSKHTQEEKRKAINSILRNMAQDASAYEILGIDPQATENEIKKAHNSLMLDIHPDKNGDEKAQEAAKCLNGCKEMLLDPVKREQHNAYLRKKQERNATTFETFDEEFHPNAFGSGDEGDDTSDSDESTTIPEPDPKIKDYHKRITAILKRNPIPTEESKEDLKRVNLKIRKRNAKNRLNEDLYQLPVTFITSTLHSLNEAKRELETCNDPSKRHDVLQKVKGLLDNTKDDMRAECMKPAHQWPLEWATIISKAIDTIFKPLLDVKPNFRPSNKTSTSGLPKKKRPGVSGHTELDIAMPDVGLEHRQPQTQVFAWPGRGFTWQGERILAYKPFYRIYPVDGEKKRIMTGARFIVDASKDSQSHTAIRARTSDEIGSFAAQAYHELPDDEKCFIMDHDDVNRSSYMQQHFRRILGVCWRAPINGPDRLINTWVAIEVASKDESKAIYMTRTGLRRFIGDKTADLAVDQYLVANNMVPPWGHIGQPSSYDDDQQYLRLNYPLPSQLKKQNLLYGGMNQPTLLRGPTSQSDKLVDVLEKLSLRLDKLDIFMIEANEEKEEARKHRIMVENRLEY